MLQEAITQQKIYSHVNKTFFLSNILHIYIFLGRFGIFTAQSVIPQDYLIQLSFLQIATSWQNLSTTSNQLVLGLFFQSTLIWYTEMNSVPHHVVFPYTFSGCENRDFIKSNCCLQISYNGMLYLDTIFWYILKKSVHN